MTVRSLSVPASELLGLFVLARTVVVNEPTGAVAAALLILYWAVLGFVGFRLCALVVRVGRVAEPPGLRRLRAGALLIAAGLALAAEQNLSATARAGGIGLSLGLVAVTAVLVAVGLDLRRAPPCPGSPARHRSRRTGTTSCPPLARSSLASVRPALDAAAGDVGRVRDRRQRVVVVRRGGARRRRCARVRGWPDRARSSCRSRPSTTTDTISGLSRTRAVTRIRCRVAFRSGVRTRCRSTSAKTWV